MSKRRQPSVSEPIKPFPSRGASQQQKAAKPGVYFMSFLKLPTMSSSVSASSPPLSLSSLPLPLRHASPQCVRRYQIRFEHCECHVIDSAYSMSFFRILRAVPICPSFKNDALLVRVQLDTRAEQRDLKATLQQEVCVAECCMTVYYSRYPNTTRVVSDTATRGLRCIVLQCVAVRTRVQHRDLPTTLQKEVCIAMYCDVLQRVAACCSTYQSTS